MKVILSMAMSANGIIASKEGSEDFLSHDNWVQFVRLVKRTNCFLYGRKTYEAVIQWPEEYLANLQGVRKLVLSHSSESLKSDFEPVHSPEEAVQRLEALGFQEMVVAGGAYINSEFARRGLIDEVILDVNPIMVGEGIPLFAPADFMMKLKLRDAVRISDQVFELRYIVQK